MNKLYSLLPFILSFVSLIVFLCFVFSYRIKLYKGKNLDILIIIFRSFIALGLFIRLYKERLIYIYKSGFDYMPTFDSLLVSVILFQSLEYYLKSMVNDNEKNGEKKYDLNRLIKNNIFFNMIVIILIIFMEMIRMKVLLK